MFRMKGYSGRPLLMLALVMALSLLFSACTAEPAAEPQGAAVDSETETSTEEMEEETGSEEMAEETTEETVAEETYTVDFGYQSSLWGAPLILADVENFWQEHSLEPNSQRFSAGKDVRDALLSGSAEAGSIGATPFIVAASTGEMKMIAVAGYLGDTVAVVAGNDTGIETVEDLAGKNVAARAGSITELIFLTEVLPAFGMSQEDINLRNVSFDDQVAALTTGEVDAFVGLEPFVSIAESQGIGSSIVTFGEYDRLPNVFAVSTQYLEANPEAVVNMLTAYHDTTQWMEEDFEAAVDALYEDFSAQGLEIERDALAQALGRVDVNPLLTDEVRQYLEDQANLLIEEGQITQMPDWDSVLATDIQEQAITDYWANRMSE